MLNLGEIWDINTRTEKYLCHCIMFNRVFLSIVILLESCHFFSSSKGLSIGIFFEYCNIVGELSFFFKL